MEPKPKRSTNGIGVDAHGGPVIDPTANVLSLVDAAVKRLDDLAEADRRSNHLEHEHVREIATLRASHEKELRDMEAFRLNAIRQVDQLAVSTAADRALQAIQALAATTASNADNLRNALASTATTIATQTTAANAAMTERIAALEKSSYLGAGRSGVSDPMLTELMLEVRKLSSREDTSSGKGQGINLAWGVLIGTAGLIMTVLGIAAIVTR